MDNNIFICLYCNKVLDDNCFNSKIGRFCNEQHYEEYINSLSNEEFIHIMHSICA